MTRVTAGVVPAEVAAAWGWAPTATQLHAGGLINKTFFVRDGDAPIAVLQQLHPIFGAEVNLDIEAVTAHLAEHGLATPRLIRTLGAQAWVVHEERVWRALTYVPGETTDVVPSLEWAETGGRLVGRFHRALADLQYSYRFTRAGVHDTAKHLAKLRAGVEASDDAETVELGRAILAAAAELPPMPDTPRRHIHGDLKISNLIFRRSPLAAVCLIDLDTVNLGTLAFELGDAMRSWCNPAGEDATQIRFDLAIFTAAIRGFRAEADALVSDAERSSVAVGLETVCIELAARFAADLFHPPYFGWNPEKFASRRAHNLVRARAQLALGLDVRRVRADALDALAASLV